VREGATRPPAVRPLAAAELPSPPFHVLVHRRQSAAAAGVLPLLRLRQRELQGTRGELVVVVGQAEHGERRRRCTVTSWSMALVRVGTSEEQGGEQGLEEVRSHLPRPLAAASWR